ncbi:putative ankyrin repeat protein RF_0580 [Ptychodera flava]|uniref:putative ankyrin repeat protein RF_0580 n=1 Tax=Ptychodera flava TaxID=63121 RepID=UPI00396AA8C6
MTPFHVAALMDHGEILQDFLSKGGDVNKTDSYGLSPLHFAASGRNCVESVELLVAAKSDVNQKDKAGKTALHCAAGNQTQRAADIVKILCDANAKVNIADKQMKDTPLHITARNNNVKAAGFLIDKGADVNALNKRGKTPIELALDGHCAEVASLLVESGAGADTK